MSSLVLVSRSKRSAIRRALTHARRRRSMWDARCSTRTWASRSERRARRELSFYFTLYGSTDAVRADVQLSRNGRSIAEAPVELPRASGARIQHVGRLPIGDLPPGTYELRIHVSDGRQELSRTAFFTVVK